MFSAGSAQAGSNFRENYRNRNLTLHNYRYVEQLIWTGRVCNKSIRAIFDFLFRFWLSLSTGQPGGKVSAPGQARLILGRKSWASPTRPVNITVLHPFVGVFFSSPFLDCTGNQRCTIIGDNIIYKHHGVLSRQASPFTFHGGCELVNGPKWHRARNVIKE
jgi:hypothetical protein